MQRDKVNLDIFWLKDASLEDVETLPDSDTLAREIADNLESALEQFSSISEDLVDEQRFFYPLARQLSVSLYDNYQNFLGKLFYWEFPGLINHKSRNNNTGAISAVSHIYPIWN